MTKTCIDRKDPSTNRETAVPSDVLSTVEQANRILDEQLGSVGHLPLEATWRHFEKHPVAGWTVTLHFSVDGHYGYDQELRVDDLCRSEQARELIREALWNFGQSISTQVGEQIRQIRTDLRELLQELHVVGGA